MSILTVVDNHSVDLARLPLGSVVLDVGCRGFRFAEFFAALGHRVLAMDPGEKAPVGGNPRVEFYPLALTASAGMGKLVQTQDLEARYVVSEGTEVDEPYLLVGCCNLPWLMEKVWHIKELGLMKLNMEGGEFDVLDQLHAPVADQIVVSFHEHTPRKRGQGAIDALVQRLGKWYDVVRHEWDERYCAGRNAWDTVLVRR